MIRWMTRLVVIGLVGPVVACGVQAGPTGRARIDNSASTLGGSGELCRQSLRRFTRLLAEERGRLWADLIRPGTTRAPDWPVRHQFAVPYQDQSSPRHSANAIQAQRRKVDKNVADELAAQPPDGHTDLVGAFWAAGVSFREAPKDSQRFLFLCTDGLDNRLVRPPGAITMSLADRVLDDIEAEDALPALEGVTVWIDTISAEARDDLSPTEQQAVDHFLRGLVTRGGGELRGIGPGVGP